MEVINSGCAWHHSEKRACNAVPAGVVTAQHVSLVLLRSCCRLLALSCVCAARYTHCCSAPHLRRKLLGDDC
eukprot:4132169-Amphidinium_carterae.1